MALPKKKKKTKYLWLYEFTVIYLFVLFKTWYIKWSSSSQWKWKSQSGFLRYHVTSTQLNRSNSRNNRLKHIKLQIRERTLRITSGSANWTVDVLLHSNNNFFGCEWNKRYKTKGTMIMPKNMARKKKKRKISFIMFTCSKYLRCVFMAMHCAQNSPN